MSDPGGPQGAPPPGTAPTAGQPPTPPGYPQPGWPPGGQPPQPPQGTYPPGPPPDGGGRSRTPLIVGLTAVFVVLVALVTFIVVIVRSDPASANEVVLAGALEPGPDPYTPSVAKEPAPGTSVAPTTAPTVAPPSPGSTRTYDGGQPGLYGGTRDVSSCDPELMLRYLDENPDKKAAWAGVQGIAASEVRSYVARLTPVVLRADTWVVNHGYANGRATTIAAVLQVGTAVLVDAYGVPRVKCYCGNPLTPPTVYANPTYVGVRWATFTPTTVVVVQQNTTIINDFTIIDTYTGEPFVRPAGSDGGRDGDEPGKTTTTTEGSATTGPTSTSSSLPSPSVTPPRETSTTARPSTTATTSPPSSPTTQPSTSTTASTAPDIVDANGLAIDKLSVCGFHFTFEGIDPTSDPYRFIITRDVLIDGQGKAQRATWSLDYRSGVMTPTNPVAAELSGECPSLGLSTAGQR
jgi:hypothetical protein